MFEKLIELDKKLSRIHIETRIKGYIFLCGMGGLLYVFYVIFKFLFQDVLERPFDDHFHMFFQWLLISYFVVGAIAIHLCYHFLTKKAWLLSLPCLTILWATALASMFALETSAGYPVIQFIYVIVVVVQLFFLVMVLLKRDASPTVLKRWFKIYMFLAVLLVAYLFLPGLLNGDGRWSGPDHVRFYEKKYGAEVADALVGPSVIIFTVAFIVGIAMSGFIKLFTRFRFDKFDEVGSSTVAYLLFCASPVKGFVGRFLYISKGNKDFVDETTFLRESQGVYYFKRSLFRGSAEEFAFSKEEGMEEGIYSCKVANSDKAPYQVMALYEEKPGQWRPFEFDEIEEVKAEE